MKHYILYYHGGSCNHGCEALVRTTAELLNYKNNRITLASFHPEDDKNYGIDQLCDIHRMYEVNDVSRWNPRWLKAYADFRFGNKPNAVDDLLMLNALNAKKGDIALSIGGDNYCYNDTQGLIRANGLFRRNGIKTVLWGCSIEPELLEDPVIAEDISKFDLITARESMSYEAIKKVNKNTILVSDSAFHLKTVKKPLPDGFDNKDIIGLNLSPMAEKYEEKIGMTRTNYNQLIEFVLSSTKMSILLIPHVIVNSHDDREINRYFYDKYKHTKRIAMIDDNNCEVLKGYISRCRFFVGARTHATVAAYSTFVPTLVLGYSVKSKGISKDLFGGFENYVVPVQRLNAPFELVSSFKWILENEMQLKNQLVKVMPNYISQINKGVELLNSL